MPVITEVMELRRKNGHEFETSGDHVVSSRPVQQSTTLLKLYHTPLSQKTLHKIIPFTLCRIQGYSKRCFNGYRACYTSMRELSLDSQNPYKDQTQYLPIQL